VSEDCSDCSTTPRGVQLDGDVTITELTGGAAGLGRIEATLSITHLQEYVDENYIAREWISMDWNAGDASSEWELVISHNPPRWDPGERSHAAFIPVNDGEQTRAGPWILIETMIESTQNVRGCLPDSFTCHDDTRPDINLTTTLKPVASAIVIPHPVTWVQMQNESSTNDTPTKMEDFRQMFEVGVEVDGGEFWCTDVQDEVISSNSWQVSATESVSIAPMGIWIDALGLPSSSFTPNSGIWSEVETNNRDCATLFDDQGIMRLGFSTS
nr:hypothetical protein [Candidatus Poseidoniaceae archaeon]